jgi:hypothetical protein
VTRDALDMDALTTCALASVYGFLQGAWPFGMIEAILAGVAARRWHVKLRASTVVKESSAPGIAAPKSGTHAPSPTLVKTPGPASAPAHRP